MQQSGFTRQTIHYYVRIGLLPKPKRTSRTYALYSRDTIDLLKSIKECQEVLRFSLDEIAEIFSKTDYDVRRVRNALDEYKDSRVPGLRLDGSHLQFMSTNQILAALQPKPPDGWIDELQLQEMIGVQGDRFPPSTVGLIRSVWKLCQLGFSLEDLRPMADGIRKLSEAELATLHCGLNKKGVARNGYTTALRIVDSLEQFAHWKRKETLRAGFDAGTRRFTHLFIGPNRKHILPSETFLSELGLNREIDRLLNGLDRSPRSRKALSDLARAYSLRSDWFSLADVSQQILHLDPQNIRATADLSRALFYLGGIDRSVDLLEKRLRMGNDPLLKFRLGQSLLLQARDAGFAELIYAARRKQQLTTEALQEARGVPATRRWILLDRALDDLTVADPLLLNQPTIEDLEELCQEYQALTERGRSVLSRISLVMGRLLAMYALYLVYRRHDHSKAEGLLRSIIEIDPHSALANRPILLSPSISPKRGIDEGTFQAERD